MQPGVCCCGIVDRWMMEPFKRHTHRQYEAVVWRSKPVKGLWRQRTLERRQMWRRRFLEHKPLESQVAQSVSGRKKEDETLFLHVRHNRMHTGRWMHTHADTQTRRHAHTVTCTHTHTPRLSSTVMRCLAHWVLPLVCVWVHTAVLHINGEWNSGSDQKKKKKKKSHTPRLPTHAHAKTDLCEFLQSTTEAWEQSRDIEERQSDREKMSRPTVQITFRGASRTQDQLDCSTVWAQMCPSVLWGTTSCSQLCLGKWMCF